MTTTDDLRDAFAELERRGQAAVAASTQRLVSIEQMAEPDQDPTPKLRYEPVPARTRHVASLGSAAVLVAVLAVGAVLSWSLWFGAPASNPAIDPANSSSPMTIKSCALNSHGLLDAHGTAYDPGAHAVIYSFALDATPSDSTAGATVPRSVLVPAGKSVPWSISDVALDGRAAPAGTAVRCELERPVVVTQVTSAGPLPIAQDALAASLRSQCNQGFG